jgi:hypothetical protein
MEEKKKYRQTTLHEFMPEATRQTTLEEFL